VVEEEKEEADDNDGTEDPESEESHRARETLRADEWPLFHFSARTPLILLFLACTRLIFPLCFLIQW
jgi:hypothetical protein